MEILHFSAVILNKFLDVQSFNKKDSNTNLVASKHIKREKGSLPVDVRGSKTSLL